MLFNIIEHKKAEINQREIDYPLSHFIDQLVQSDRNFKTAISQSGMRFILECKKASPSKALIKPDYNLSSIAASYSPFADAISVLTDSRFFQGKLNDLQTVRSLVEQPVLCKDFFISPYQIYEARYYGADAILLMLSVLDNATYQILSTIAKKLNLDVLTEVHDETELQRALDMNAEIIGINNRNLQTLEIDLSTSRRLAKLIPSDRVIVSESGYSNHSEMRSVSHLVNAYLIGSSLMAADHLDFALRELLFGRIKICGLSDSETIDIAYKNGSRYAGIIFAESSPRKVEFDSLKTHSPIELVGVFQNQSIEFILKKVNDFNLAIVQLHGDESVSFVQSLRNQLAESIQIWNASATTDFMPMPEIDRYLFDTRSNGKFGGTGKSFNWNQLPEVYQDQFILAGGLNVDNINDAMKTNCWAYDFNSGLESEIAIKDPVKISRLFKRIRGIA